ncbi:Uncharacterized protein APZ42_004551, partial [Daphnia magna]
TRSSRSPWDHWDIEDRRGSNEIVEVAVGPPGHRGSPPSPVIHAHEDDGKTEDGTVEYCPFGICLVHSLL